jgi:hypothetical protein
MIESLVLGRLGLHMGNRIFSTIPPGVGKLWGLGWYDESGNLTSRLAGSIKGEDEAGKCYNAIVAELLAFGGMNYAEVMTIVEKYQ